MSYPSLRQLLEVGAHFGHKKEYSHPAAKQFVYTVKDGILVINLEKTVEQLTTAVNFLKKIKKTGGKILFVGTKPQAQEAVKSTALALGEPYITTRWLGGTLTNFETIKKSLFQLQELEKIINDPSFEVRRKREKLHLKEKYAKLTSIFEGIITLTKAPDVLFVVDANYEDVAVSEANKVFIPVVAVMDTNADPNLITHIIPVNDESKRAIKLIMNVIATELKDVKLEKQEPKKEENVGRKVEERPKKAVKAVKVVKKVTKPAKSARSGKLVAKSRKIKK